MYACAVTAPSRESQRSSVSPHRLDHSLDLVNLGNRVWTASDRHRCRHDGTSSRKTISTMHVYPSHFTLPISIPSAHFLSPPCFTPGNSTSLRPGYTAGQLSLSSTKTSSIGGSHCFSSPRLDTSQANGHTNGKVSEDAPVQSQTSPIRRNGHRVNDEASNLSQDFDTSLLGSTPSYPSVVCSTPYTMSVKLEGSSAKMYLSDSEFEKVFQLSRVAFYRLPEWKRNDLKRRVDLF
ncbi:unnamed protein product [Hydatigera taeniaeformis]|uniref:HP domain-containing protein n=1 Tax=Hydatigena taeniaeformis TaxID=6205 RepID=A0A0R3X8J1_HYDTA|nr:unnamed protein product [Hydatigera taeniaeformis]